MWLWKILFPVTICLFGCNHCSEFIVPRNDGKMRYFRGFETDEFHFKIKNDATNAKNISYIYLLDNLDARTNYGRYMRISVRYDVHGTTWLNIYSFNSGLTASERTARFRDKPDKDGFRGYWIRRQRHLYNGRLNRWEFGQEWDNVHPIMRIELKFPFFPQFFALEGFSTWKLEQILFGRAASSFGFFSSADLSIVHMPTFFPPMAKMMDLQKNAPISANRELLDRQNLKFSGQEILSISPEISKKSSFINGSPVSNNSSTTLKNSTSKTKTPSSSLELPKRRKLNYLKKRKIKAQSDLPSKSNNSGIQINLPNITFPKIAIPPVTLSSPSALKFTLPNLTFPKINIPSVTMPSVKLPKITLPFTFPKINIPSVTMPSIKLPKITLPNVTFPKINFPSVTMPNIKLPKITLPNITFPKIGIKSVTIPIMKLQDLPNVTFSKTDLLSVTSPSVKFSKMTFSNVTFPKREIPSVTLPSVELLKITIPDVTFAKIVIPSITIPNVQLPKITWPDVPYPNITFPDLENPIMTLLPMIQPNVTPPYTDV